MAQVSTNSIPFKDKSFLYLPWLQNRPKEKQFVLNCDSQEWKLPEYNSLRDNHLKSFFTRPNIRSVLTKNGVVDDNGNVSKEFQHSGNFPGSKRHSNRFKLPPIPGDPQIAIQKMVTPYKSTRLQAAEFRLRKQQSAPQKRIHSVGDAELISKIYRMNSLKAQSLTTIRKIKPLSKEQFEEVFAKYEVKVQKNPAGHEGDSVAEEHSTERKSVISSEEDNGRTLENQETQETQETQEQLPPSTPKKQDFPLPNLNSIIKETKNLIQTNNLEINEKDIADSVFGETDKKQENDWIEEVCPLGRSSLLKKSVESILHLSNA